MHTAKLGYLEVARIGLGKALQMRFATVALERADLADALGAPPLTDYGSINSQISGEKPRRALGRNPRRLDALGELARPSN